MTSSCKFYRKQSHFVHQAATPAEKEWHDISGVFPTAAQAAAVPLDGYPGWSETRIVEVDLSSLTEFQREFWGVQDE